jgi:hypothetical protein
VLRSSSSSAAEAAKALPQLLTSAITQCETLTDVLQVGVRCLLPFVALYIVGQLCGWPYF